MAYADSLTTVASFVAMWMSARKYLSSWVAWFLIDIVQIALYVLKGFSSDPGLFFYAALYTVYLAMAVWGCWAGGAGWQRDFGANRPESRVRPR